MNVKSKLPKDLILPFLGFIALIVFYFQSPIVYQKWVWFVWGANFLFAALLITFQVIQFSVQKKWPQALRSLFLILPTGFAHLIFGAFLSFFAQMEPLDYFGPNGYINRFSFEKWFELFSASDAFLLFYLTTKTYYFFSPDSNKLSGLPLIRDPLLQLVGAIAIPLALMAMGAPKEGLALRPEIFISLAALAFIPWRLFFSSDVQSLIYDKLIHIQPDQLQFPMQVKVEGAKGWGILMALMGGAFVIISIKWAPLLLVATFKDSLFQFLFGFLTFLMFFLIGSLFFLVGINLQWSRKYFLITKTQVQISQRILIPFPMTKKWTVSLNQYDSPSKVEKKVDSDDGPSYWVYQVVLRKKQPSLTTPKTLSERVFDDSEILLLETYVNDNFENAFNELKQVFDGEIH